MDKDKHKPQHVSTYLEELVDTKQLQERVDRCIMVLKEHDVKFDAIAYCGMSGGLIAPILAVMMDKSLIMVRKGDDRLYPSDSHSDLLVEGDYAARSYIVADDFISSGKTVREIRKRVKKFAPGAKFVGAIEACTRIQYSKPRQVRFRTVIELEQTDGINVTPEEEDWRAFGKYSY